MSLEGGGASIGKGLDCRIDFDIISSCFSFKSSRVFKDRLKVSFRALLSCASSRQSLTAIGIAAQLASLIGNARAQD